MKKRRILSLLLSAVMCISALPITSSAASDGIAVGTDVLDGVKPKASSSLADVNVADGNRYLHLYNRSRTDETGAACTSGVGYRINGTVKANTVYYVSFDVRNSVSGINVSDGLSNSEHPRMYHTLRTNINLVDIENFDGATVATELHSLAPSNKVLTNLGYTFKHSGNKLPIYRSANGYYNLAAGNGWTYAEFIFIPRQDSVNPTIAYYRVPERADIPVDIDNFKIWYYEDGSDAPTYIVNEDFESGTVSEKVGYSEATRPGRFLTTTGYNVNNTSGKVAFVEEYDYTWFSAPQTASVTYDLSKKTLDGGVYTLYGEARLDYYDRYFNDEKNSLYDGEDNKAKLTLTVSGGASTETKTVDITSEWSSFDGVKLYVPDGVIPEDVTVTLTVSDDTERADKGVDIRGLELVKTGTARDIPEDKLPENLLDGIVPVSSQTVTQRNLTDGNRYLHLYDRLDKDGTGAACTSGLGYLYGGTLKAGTVYYVSFDTRLSANCISVAESSSNDSRMFHKAAINVTVEDIVDRGGTDFNNSNAHDKNALVLTSTLKSDTAYTFKTSENKLMGTRSGAGYYNLVPTTDWTHAEFALVTKSDATNATIAYFRVPARADVPVDVDNFKLWYYKDGETEPTYLVNEDFEDGTASELLALHNDIMGKDSTESRKGKFFTTNTTIGNTTSGTLCLEKEYDHYEIAAPDLKEASVNYSFGSEKTLENGVYTLSGDVRMDYFDDYFADTANAKHDGEDNKATLTAEAKVGGRTVVLGSMPVTSEWASLNGFKLYISDATANNITDITLTFTDETMRDNRAYGIGNIRFTKTAGANSDEIPDYRNLMNYAAASYSDEAYTVNVEDGNSYLHLYDRQPKHPTNGSNITPGIRWCSNAGMKANTVYYVSFDVRLSVESITKNETGNNQDKANMYHQLKVQNLTLEDISQKGHTQAFDGLHPTPTDKLLDNTGYTFRHTDNKLKTSFAGAGFWNLILSNEWTYAEFAFVPTEKINRDGILALFRSGDSFRDVPLDIDNFKVWYYESGSNTPTYLYSEDFEDGERGSFVADYNGTGTRDKFITSNGINVVPGAAKLDLAHEYDYTKIPAADGNATVTYSFGEGIELTTGVYVLDSDVRLDYCDPNNYWVEGEDNKASYTVKATIDGNETVISENTVTSEWQGINSAVITVPAGETLTLTKITMTMADETGATNKALNVNNARLYKMTDATDSSDAAWTSDCEIVSEDYVIDGATNTYLHVSGRGNYYDAVKYEEPDITLEKGKYYTLDLYMRAPAFENGEAVTSLINIYHTGLVSQFQISDEAIGDMHSGKFDTMYGSAVLDTKWMRYTVTFSPISDINGLTLYFNSPGSANHATVFDIAGLSLALSDKDGNIKGEELISRGGRFADDGEAGWSTEIFKDGEDMEIVFMSDVMYKRVLNDGNSDTVLVYASNDVFDAGVYTVSGMVKLGKRDMDAVEYRLVRLGNTLYMEYVESDDNEAILTATFGGETIGSVTVTDGWCDIEFQLVFEEAVRSNNLALTLDGAHYLDFAELTVKRIA